MARQLAHLVEMAEASNIDLRVLPSDSEVFAATFGAFLLLSSCGNAPTMAFQENRAGLTYLAKPYEIETHMDLFTYLHDVALSPAKSADIIRTTAKEKYPS